MEKVVKVKDIQSILEKNFPVDIKETWDNVGLLVGDKDIVVEKIQISLDLTDRVLENAIKNKVNLIITHHPLIFKPLYKINNETKIGQKILKLIKNGIALYSLHTNLDSASNGLNEYIAKKIGGENLIILSPIEEKLYKIKIFIPEDVFDKVKNAVLKYNSFGSEKYEKTYYSGEVDEFFSAKEIAKPFADTGNRLKTLEIISYAKDIGRIVSEMKKVHPYEEPGYEILELKNTIDKNGIGRYFKLDQKTKISDFIETVKKRLNLKTVRAVYDEDKLISKVGVVNGSGSSFIKTANSKGIELFITGDIKYHEALEALENNMVLLDIGHYESEIIFSDIILEVLKSQNKEIIVFNENPVFKYL